VFDVQDYQVGDKVGPKHRLERLHRGDQEELFDAVVPHLVDNGWNGREQWVGVKQAVATPDQGEGIEGKEVWMATVAWAGRTEESNLFVILCCKQVNVWCWLSETDTASGYGGAPRTIKGSCSKKKENPKQCKT
jgi:hypothetical protein